MRIRLNRLGQFSRDAWLLVIVCGLSAVSFFGIQMLLKVLYILRLGHGTEYVGIFNASSALVYMGMGLPSGMLGSRWGASRTMLIGSIMAVFGMAALPMTEYMPSWAWSAWPIVSQVILTVGWSMFDVNLVPALSATTTLQNRSRAFALSGVLRGMGMLLGTLLGGALPGLFAGMLGQTLNTAAPYRFSLGVGAVLGLIVFVPLSMIGQVKSGLTREQSTAQGSFPLLPVGLMVAYIYLRNAGWAAGQAFCGAYMDSVLALPTWGIGLLTALGQAASIVTPLLVPRLAARRSNGWTLMMASVGTALSLLPLAMIRHWAAAGLGQFGIVVLSAIWLPALQVFQVELVDSKWRSLAYGAASMAMGLGFGSTSLAGGYIIAAWGYSTLFYIGVGLSIAGAIMMWVILKSPVLRRC